MLRFFNSIWKLDILSVKKPDCIKSGIKMFQILGTITNNRLSVSTLNLQVEAYGGETQDLNFQLEVFPNGEEGEDNSDYVAVFLTSRRQEDLEVKYDFSVQKADGIWWVHLNDGHS